MSSVTNKAKATKTTKPADADDATNDSTSKNQSFFEKNKWLILGGLILLVLLVAIVLFMLWKKGKLGKGKSSCKTNGSDLATDEMVVNHEK